jgi:flagellar biosynthesis chaperone FliJ
MRRFAWRLQRVLDVKTKEEQFKRMELLRLTEQLAAKRSELLLCRRVLRDAIQGIAHDPSGRLAAQEFVLRHAATNDRQIRRLGHEIAELETRQREKTTEVLAVRRFKESLERLRTEAQTRFIRDCERLEQKEMDDRTTMAFARRGSHPYDAESAGLVPRGRDS